MEGIAALSYLFLLFIVLHQVTIVPPRIAQLPIRLILSLPGLIRSPRYVHQWQHPELLISKIDPLQGFLTKFPSSEISLPTLLLLWILMPPQKI